MRLLLNPGRNKHLIYHIFGWLTFIVYEVSFVKLIRWTTIDVSIWSGYVFPYLINICFFYFHALITMNIGFGKILKKPIQFIFLIILEVFVYLVLMGIKDFHFLSNKKSFISSFYPTRITLIQQLWRGIYFLIFSTAFWLVNKSFKKEQKLKEAETKILLKQKEKQELELKLISTHNAFLQSQINPHLLFNTLNFIHSEVQQTSTKASDAIIVLSDMMRYSLTETKIDGKVLLDKEIEQIHNLIRINQFRFNNKLSINFITKGDHSNISIIPLLLLPFVENLFKYAELMDEFNPARVFLEVNGTELYFSTFNRKTKAINYHSTLIGNENVKTRLDAFYQHCFTLDIKNSDTTFTVNLSIDLKPNI